MDDLARLGFTGVLHTFSENDLAYYRDQMARIVRVSHDAGLEVQVGPWGLGGVFGGEAESLFAQQHPELGQVFANGRRIASPCPTQPAFHAFVRDWARAAVELGAERVFWDEPHWAHPRRFGEPEFNWACVCTSCQQLYAQRCGPPMPAILRPAELTPDVRTCRDQVLVDLLADLVGYVRSLGGRSTVCLLPQVAGMNAGIDDWASVAALEGLDTIATDPYWSFFGMDARTFVGEQSRRIASLAAKHQLGAQIWVQGFGLDPAQAGEITAAVAAAKEAGVDDLWTWAYEAAGHMTYLRTRDPDQVWAALVSAMTGGSADG